jgi:hypothetical protein
VHRVEKISRWGEFFWSNLIWDLGKILHGKKNCRAHESKCTTKICLSSVRNKNARQSFFKKITMLSVEGEENTLSCVVEKTHGKSLFAVRLKKTHGKDFDARQM